MKPILPLVKLRHHPSILTFTTNNCLLSLLTPAVVLALHSNRLVQNLSLIWP